mgnify:FL=1
MVTAFFILRSITNYFYLLKSNKKTKKNFNLIYSYLSFYLFFVLEFLKRYMYISIIKPKNRMGC